MPPLAWPGIRDALIACGTLMLLAAGCAAAATVLRRWGRRRRFYEGPVPRDGRPLDEHEDQRLGQIAITYIYTAEKPPPRGKMMKFTARLRALLGIRKRAGKHRAPDGPPEPPEPAQDQEPPRLGRPHPRPDETLMDWPGHGGRVGPYIDQPRDDHGPAEARVRAWYRDRYGPAQ